MKKIILTIIFVSASFIANSQETIITTGGNAQGSGTVSYSVGQLITAVNRDNNSSISEGIQQSIELFVLSNPELIALNLKAITYPNPTKNKILLSLKDNKLTNLIFSISDVNGRLLKRGKVNKENTTIALKDYAKGIYLLKVHQNKKQIKTFKIIKN
jgi:hypothetical protein